MKSKLQLLLMVVISLTIQTTLSFSQTIYSNYVDGTIYLKVQDTSTLQLVSYNYSNVALNLIFTQYGVNVATIRQPYPDSTISIPLTKIYRINFSDSSQVDSLIAHLMLVPEVQYAEKVPLDSVVYTPNDFNNLQWQLTKINAFQAWDVTHGSTSVVIAICDNAIRTTHEDLAANITGGFDVADNDNNPNPPSGASNSSPWVHGTHCAGIASAVTNNGVGIASIGFNTKILPIKCSPDTSNGSILTNGFDGVYYAMSQHVDVISMSWGSTGTSISDQAVVTTAYNMGIILLAAAGNSNSNGAFYPADYTNVMAIGATDANDVKSSYSNYGSSIAVMAPGDNIYSTFCGSDNSYGTLSGTSMATPLVAGLAGLVKAIHSNYTPAQIETAIRNGCDNINAENNNYIGQIGSGRINAYKTLNPTGINEITSANNFTFDIYPNPVNDKLFMDVMTVKSQTIKLSILDLLGDRLLEKSINLSSNYSKEVIELPEISSGVYLLQILSDDGVFTRKIVKK